MFVFNILILSVLYSMLSSTLVLADDFDNDDKMYTVLSPDQHLHTPRLEDFFWTGSGDGPPPPDAATPAPSPPTAIIRTTTVLATVYLDSYSPQAVTDKTTGDCVLNCGEAGVPDSLAPEIPEDRRYWLLTVIQGSTPDSLQLRLARLYQKAFLRQQERHLGIIKSLDAPTPRKKHEVHSFVVNKENKLNEIGTYSSQTPEKYLDMDSSIANVDEFELSDVTTIFENLAPLTKNSSVTYSEVIPENFEIFKNKIKSSLAHDVIEPTKLSDTDSWVLVTPTVILKKRDVSNIDKDLIDIPLEEDISNETTLFKREILKPDQQPPVRVHIQNITESAETGSVQIVYVVLVGGRAVPAAVAARDMRLVRDAEVARELGAAVTTKAEPYLKAAEGLEGEAEAGGVHGTELWALAIGSIIAVLLLLVLFALLCVARRRKSQKSAASFRAYRNELMREVERSEMKQVQDEKDGRLISVVSPSRTRPSSTLLPAYRAASASSSSTTSSGVSEVAAALRRRHKRPHALKIAQKKRVGTTDSLLASAGLGSGGSDSAPSPTSYLSMPSLAAFPRGNTVEPLSRILEPVSVRHLDIDTPPASPKTAPPKVQEKESVPRRQMASQLVRLGSIDKDPGVIGPLVWDLHCQRIKSGSKPPSPARSQVPAAGASRMRQRFTELVDDACSLFGSASNASHHTYTMDTQHGNREVAQARNEHVRVASSPRTATRPARGQSAGAGRGANVGTGEGDTSWSQCRARTSCPRPRPAPAPAPARAWPRTPPQSLGTRLPPAPTVNPAIILAEGRLPPDDPALPLISAIKNEIQRVRENATKSNT
ncbi:unnamed protein product [Parnassius mnemosyne]|uniref:Uncharacterized protein n=1 Tax=Parnassius mnemosyne TaxID=213953 RepID=A0AAV1L4Y7_9NEOP